MGDNLYLGYLNGILNIQSKIGFGNWSPSMLSSIHVSLHFERFNQRFQNVKNTEEATLESVRS